MAFFDGHCHLHHDRFKENLPAVLERMRKTGTTAVTHGTNAQSNAAELAIAHANPDVVKLAMGLDAFSADEDLGAHLAFLEAHKADLAAVGEIGLDQHYFGAEKMARQKKVFEAQLAFAEKNNLAAVIHTREAVTQVLDTLTAFKGIHVLHFCLEKGHAPRALEQGCYLSLPTVQSKDRTWIAKNAPLEQLLCETDSPYGWRGQ
ncbi:MAG: TatD family hydrolase, partial [Candidatus Micrarchaeota archaeon]|nr:TatD family hydrolase [Candidatus Micrarchaeota archaeon]